MIDTRSRVFRPVRLALPILLFSIFTAGSCENGGTNPFPLVPFAARYEATFAATWSDTTHPDDFPPGPHFSGLVGAVHEDGVRFWAPGELASEGIERMAEIGSKSPLDDEVAAAIQAGTADSLLSGGGINPSPGSVRLGLTATRDFPLVTLVSMLAPSPDWFVGVHDLSLFRDGAWVASHVETLFVYDAGTDSGPTYLSPNDDTQPPAPIARIETSPFRVNGEVRPVGTFTFVRID